MPLDPGLVRTQRWMQAAIMTPGDCESAVAAEAVAAEVPAAQATGMILPSKTMEPLERLDIYRGMYEARLSEALEVDYPGLADFLGEHRFAELASLYIGENPSRTYTLNRLGDNLPGFIPDVEGLPREKFVQDLARLEHAQSIVFDAEETPALTQQQIAAVPEESWPDARLTPIAAFHLIELRYPAHLYLRAMRDNKPRPPIRRKQTYLVIHRRDYALMSMELTKQGYAVLISLASGATLGEAILAHKMHTPARHKQLFTMFQQWMSEGLFQSVSLAAQ